MGQGQCCQGEDRKVTANQHSLGPFFHRTVTGGFQEKECRAIKPWITQLMLKKLWKGVREIVGGVASDVGDFVSDSLDLVAARVPLERAAKPGEVTLDLPGYSQIDTYCCGVVAGIMALKHFKPRASFTRFYQRVNPHRVHGTPTPRLIRALRQSGVRVTERSDLAFDDLCAAIDSGHPVIMTIHNPGTEADEDHWVVVYGYGKRPARVFLATNGVPLFTSNRLPRRKFERLWSPHGNGLICSMPKRQSPWRLAAMRRGTRSSARHDA